MNGMKTEELELLIVQHEMSRLELKESFDVECIETACAFANAAGGYVIIGVDNSGQLSKLTSDTSDEMSKAQSAEIALKTALKIALKTGGKSDADEIVGKIVAVRDELKRNPRLSLSAIAAALKLSERMVDDYVGALKSIGALRRKDGKKMGEWEVLK